MAKDAAAQRLQAAYLTVTMTSRRDDLFPSGSIGRSQGLFIQRTPSPAPSLTRETLTAHPLLSPSPASAPTSAAPTTDAQDVTSPGMRYATYTPRHRTAPTTGTTLQSSLPVSPQQQQQPGGSAAATKLQLMNLKAGAQSIGLETNSLGWEILDKLVAEHDSNPEWSDIWTALTIGKATLLLPVENGGSADITADFMKDHVALCESPSGDNIPIVTLSGLRGVLVGDTLTLRSSLLPNSKPFEDLLDPSTRVTVFASLPPLPAIPSSPLSQSYPIFTLPGYTNTLPLPPHVVAKPPLPPRPGQRAPSQTSSSRISSSFASLFGKSSAPAAPAPVPSPQNAEHEHAIEVAAYTIDRRIVRKDVSKAINKALKLEVKEALSSSGVPSWIVDRVHEFTAGLYPFVKSHDAKQGTTPSSLYVIEPPQETAEELARQFQAFYAELEEGLLAGGGSPVTARPAREAFLESEQEKPRERRPNGKAVSEQHARVILEAVERVLCSLFYDRLYLLPKSDDASHDEALSSRVAALNMLDLGLEHLGVDVGVAGASVTGVLKACGETLSRLENLETRCPSDKAAVLVVAHKNLVDGLSRLPPIRLKSEAELENQKNPEASHALNDEKAESSPDKNPPPIIVSPDSETQIHVDSPVGIEATASNASVTSNLPPHESQAAPAPVSTPSRSSSPTPVSGDIILPLMIFAVVKANPSHFVSHLLYTQRFRNQCVGGEESYCLVNLMAVADFLENVDLKALGLGESEKKVMSTADLTPIPVHRAAMESQTPPVSPEGVPARLRRGVEQQVDAIAGSANKVILGVVDQGFGVLRALLPGTPADAQVASPESTNADQEAAPWNAVRPGFGLLRRESGFSIASLAASLPVGRDRSKSFASTVGSTAEESGQMMVDVSSRPGSVRSVYGSDAESSVDDESQEDDEDEEGQEKEDDRHDVRSIRSFESMMGHASRRRRTRTRTRKSLTDRLASMPGLARISGPQPAQPQPQGSPSRPASLLIPPRAPTAAVNRAETPQSSRPASPVVTRIAPPNQHFLEAAADDLRLSEVRELLREYKRVVEGLRAMGGFDE